MKPQNHKEWEIKKLYGEGFKKRLALLVYSLVSIFLLFPISFIFLLTNFSLVITLWGKCKDVKSYYFFGLDFDFSVFLFSSYKGTYNVFSNELSQTFDLISIESPVFLHLQ